MSAYIVNKHHILYLLEAITSRAIMRSYSFSYYNPATKSRIPVTPDPASLADLGNMLWRENIASVSARYSDRTSATLPGPRGASFETALKTYPKLFSPTLTRCKSSKRATVTNTNPANTTPGPRAKQKPSLTLFDTTHGILCRATTRPNGALPNRFTAASGAF